VRNNKRGITLVGLIILVTSTAAVIPAGPPKPEEIPADKKGGPTTEHTVDLHEDELGVTTGKPFDSGFVFFDGEYVEPPYTLN